jgi:4-alpha-glucanotransferase
MTEAVASYLWQSGWMERPSSQPADVLAGGARFLAASPAPAVVLNLEDLWGERQPQNVPGSGRRYPSWRRKARLGLEEFSRQPKIVRLLREVDNLRRQGVKR